MTHGWGDPFGPPPPGYPAPPGYPPPQPPQDTTTLATLSVVFAFVFAPVGAVLGHLALTRTKGRDPHTRALVGLSVSYTVIVVAVIAVVVLAVTDHQPSSAATAATSSTTPATTSPRTTTATTTTTTTTTPPPSVAPTDLPNLLLGLDEIKAIMGVNGMATYKTATELEAEGDSTYDPAECESAVTIGGVRTYEGSGYRSYRMEHHAETQMYNPQVAEAVATFDTAAAAQSFVAKLIGQWRSCAGKHVTASGYGWYDVGDLVQSGPVSLVRNTANDGNRTGVEVRTLAARANVVVELFAYANTPNTEAPLNDQATTITTRILDRIPS